jgi:hypothetical protein
VPALALISFLNLKNINFCPKCGADLRLNSGAQF